MTVSVSVWLKDILPQTPGLVRSVATRELILAAREFYEKSTAWRTVLQFDMDADDADYTLTPVDADCEVTKIMDVAFNGTPMRKFFRRPDGTYEEATTPYAYFITEPDTIHLWPKPTTALADGLTAYIALVPLRTATLLPDVTEKLHYEAILDGLLGRLFSHPAKPYSDTARAQYHLSRFQNAIGEYAARAKAGNGPSWTFPRFGK